MVGCWLIGWLVDWLIEGVEGWIEKKSRHQLNEHWYKWYHKHWYKWYHIHFDTWNVIRCIASQTFMLISPRWLIKFIIHSFKHISRFRDLISVNVGWFYGFMSIIDPVPAWRGVLMGYWWCIAGVLMGYCWCIDGVLMGYWWCIAGVLMGYWWRIDGVLTVYWWWCRWSWASSSLSTNRGRSIKVMTWVFGLLFEQVTLEISWNGNSFVAQHLALNRLLMTVMLRLCNALTFW